ncbi:hypothetical protein ACQY0O_005783 [Thecaphora frezii]
MSVTPPPSIPSSSAAPAGQNSNRWGTVSGGLRSPPPAPSSGASVRRNHTVHGARQHDKPRLEKHFEQPENFEQLYNDQSGEHAAHGLESNGHDSSDYHSHDPLANASKGSDLADDYTAGLAPLQALYSKTNISRNNSLPTRHSSRLNAHMPASATHGRTSLFNSLSAITGGSDHDEHEWEKMIRADGALGDDTKEVEETLDSPWTDTHFMHRRFPSSTSSTQPLSPITRGDHIFQGHQRSGSSNAMDPIEQGFSASSPLATNFVRRHQSLNHHSGRAAGQRLAARSSDMLQQPSSAAGSQSISAQIEQAFSPHQGTVSLSATNSPIAPSNFSKAPWNQPSGQPIGSPSRFANSFPSPTEGRMSDQQRDAFGSGHGRVASSDSPSGSLMDIHASIAKLDIRGSLQPIRGDPMDGPALSATAHGHGLPQRPELLSRSSSSDIHTQSSQQRKLPSLITNRDVLARGAGTLPSQLGGPISAAAYVPPIGHAHSRQQSQENNGRSRYESELAARFGPFSAAPAPGWQEKEQLLGRPDAIADQGQAYRNNEQWGLGLSAGPPSLDANTLALSLTLAQEQQRTAMMQAQAGLYGMRPFDDAGSMAALNRQLRGAVSSPYLHQNFSNPAGRSPGLVSSPGRAPGDLPGAVSSGAGFHASGGNGHGHGNAGNGHGHGYCGSVSANGAGEPPTPIDLNALMLQKGYNPALGTFDLNPPAARFFVIKSYTEDDVHKSLKYEIWASTDKGNQRLDKAFRESAHSGPIYLFFSVNASGHFCGMAQMLTPLDYTTSSNVWAQDGKWKGTFKVRWIFVKDLPNNQLRHIRLHNTPEVKPVTQSRDTQELTADAGREVLRIMAEYQAKTSLLQDFNFYEVQSQQQAALKSQQGQQPQPPNVLGTAPGLQQQSQRGSGAMSHAVHAQQSLLAPPSAPSSSSRGVAPRIADQRDGDAREARRGNNGGGGGGGGGPLTPSRNGQLKPSQSPLSGQGRNLAATGSPRGQAVGTGLGASPQ